MSKIAFALTGPQIDYLAAVSLVPACWPTFAPAIREALTLKGLAQRGEKYALTHAGNAAAGLALFLVKASPINAAGAAEQPTFARLDRDPTAEAYT